MKVKSILSLALPLLAACLWLGFTSNSLYAQQPSSEQSSAQTSAQPSAEPSQTADQAKQQESEPKHVGGKLAQETREAEGEEENENLTHSPMVRKLASITGLSVHGAHLLALWTNFAIVAFVIFWFVRKTIPGVLRKRGETIQKALDEARAASQEANRRLADIESRLRQMDVEIGKMQIAADKEAEGEEARIQRAAEEEMRKVVEAAEQEIAAAAKQARRELSNHTADLAIALARKQIHVDSNTDQVLVRDFAAKLSGSSSPRGSGGHGDPGKDGN